MQPLFITTAKYIEEYKIELHFNNGLIGVADLKSYLKKGIFEKLQDKEFFKNFRLNNWTIEWQNGADFSPEFLYKIAEKNVTTA